MMHDLSSGSEVDPPKEPVTRPVTLERLPNHHFPSAFPAESFVLGLCLRAAGPGEEGRGRAASLAFHSWLSAVLPTQH